MKVFISLIIFLIISISYIVPDVRVSGKTFNLRIENKCHGNNGKYKYNYYFKNVKSKFCNDIKTFNSECGKTVQEFLIPIELGTTIYDFIVKITRDDVLYKAKFLQPIKDCISDDKDEITVNDDKFRLICNISDF